MRKRRAAARNGALLTVVMIIVTSRHTWAQQSRDDNDWRLSFSIREARQFDRFTNGVPEEDRINDGANASLAYSTETQRSTLTLNGRVGVNTQREPDTGRDRMNYGAGLAWGYQSSSRSQMRLSQTVSKNIRLETLSDLGILPNDLSTLTATTGWSFQHQSGPRTSWNASLGYAYREFQNVERIDGSQIVLDEDPFTDDAAIPIAPVQEPDEFDVGDGEQEVLNILATEGLDEAGAVTSHRGSGSFGLSHGFGPRTSLSIGAAGGYRSIDSRTNQNGPYASARVTLQQNTSTSSALSAGYTYSTTFIVEPGQRVHTLFGGWSYSPATSSLSIGVFGGVSRYEVDGIASTSAPIANAFISGALTSSTTVGLAYRRQFSVTRGFGRSLLIDFLSANLTQEIGSRITARVMAGASFGSEPFVEEIQRNTKRAGASLSIRIVGGLRLGTSFFYTEVERDQLASITDSQRKNWAIFLNYSTGF